MTATVPTSSGSSLSPPLSPAPPVDSAPTVPRASLHKKRKSISGDKVEKVAKLVKGEAGEPHEPGTYCHQCRTKCDPEKFLRCTRLKKFTKATPERACNLAWCERDLIKRYGISATSVRDRGWDGYDISKLDGYDRAKAYLFECPCCLDECQNSTCRKKKGLEPLGDIVKAAAKAGVSTLDLVKENYVSSIRAQKSMHPAPTVTDLFNGELSELSDPEEDAIAKATPKSKTKVKVDRKDTTRKSNPKDGVKVKTTSNKPKASMPKAEKIKNARKKADKTVKGKTVTKKSTIEKAKVERKGKDSKKELKVAKTPKVKAKAELPVEPPLFEKVDTRLSRDDVEQRIYLREFIMRFRGVLAVPDRSLGPIDDFDRPISEANVRLLAGSMLDLIREDLESSGENEELVGSVAQSREELRYFADLARFALIFNTLAGPLGLSMPPAAESVRERNDRAIRALLDLDQDEVAPAWATEGGPSRRVNASRVPLPAEVVRMLLALIDRTILVPKLRTAMDSATGEHENRRRHAQQTKEENIRWEGVKKTYLEAMWQCKSAAEIRTTKAKHDKDEHEHAMHLAILNVNLRALISRKAYRFEPLGTDLDERVYYLLTPRIIEDEGRAPVGWASGLLVWGRGIDVRVGTIGDDETLPPAVERWSHFGRSEGVKQLAKWISYRARTVAASMRPPPFSKASQTPSKMKGMHNNALGKASITPSKIVSTPKTSASTSNQLGKTGRSSLLGVVIPLSRHQSKISEPRANGFESSATTPANVSDTESELSSAPSEDDLLALLNPVGYSPSADAVDEAGAALAARLEEVAEWLSVLEWKGLGEV